MAWQIRSTCRIYFWKVAKAPKYFVSFAIVVFVTSTEGVQEPPATPQKFWSINVSMVTSSASNFLLRCSEDGSAEEHDAISLAVYLRMPGSFLTPAATISEECYPSGAINTETAHLRLLLEEGKRPEAVVLFVSGIARTEWLGDALSLDVEVHGNDFCGRKSHDFTLGSTIPLLIEGGGGCT